MKNAIEAALELTAQQETKSPTEIPYEEAYRLAMTTGRSVVEIQQEHARRATPITPLAKALAAQTAAETQCEKAAGIVSEALSVQAQFEALVKRRASIRATLERGQEFLNQSIAAIEELKLEWLRWHEIEEQSPGKTQAVYQSVAGLVMHEKIVSLFPGWQEQQSGHLHDVAEQLAHFEREHGFKAR